MNIQELKQKHSDIPEGLFCSADMHVKLSVKFALEILGECLPDSKAKFTTWYEIADKMEELKNYNK